MHSRQTEQLARLRGSELRAAYRPCRAGHGLRRRATEHTIRRRAGWALVAIGLRLAESG